MTTSAVYDLIPNYDNTQHTQYPQGDKPEETLIQTPTQLQTSGETLTSVDLTWDMVDGYHTHFILQRWRLNTDTAWTEITQPDELDRAYTDSADLLEGQHVGYRIAASDGTNQSDWSTEAWTYVLQTPGDYSYNLNAENAQIGVKYEGAATDQWSDAAGYTIAQNYRVFRGSKSWECRKRAWADDSSGGFGTWGGRKNLDTPVTKGQTIHTQWSVFLPSDFDWYAIPFLKFFRIHTRAASGDNEGFHDIYIHNDGELHLHDEVNDNLVSMTPPQTMSKNVWETFEMEIYLHESAGHVRVWRNIGGTMTLIRERANYPTIKSATSEINSVLLFTYWNGTGVPVDEQICQADEIILEPNQNNLTNTDSNGYKIIGI